MCELITQTLPFHGVASFKVPAMVVKGARPFISNEVIAATPKEYLELMKQV